MSKADDLFDKTCKKVLKKGELYTSERGLDSEGNKVHARWPDGTPAKAIGCFCVQNRYNLAKEFPIITKRPVPLKTAVDELLWIWQKKSNNVKDLNSHIWDEWADESGSIGKAYGYQLGVKHKYKEGDFDQVDRVIFDLTHSPYNRRIITNLYTHEDLHDMHLYPCAYNVQFIVRDGRLNAFLNQRSQDMLAANGFNVTQYAVLVHMFAQVCGFKVGELVHNIVDCHIYDRHIDTIKELVQRTSYPAPKFFINPEIKNFYEFTVDDFKLENYQCGPQIKNIPVAI